jgi:hypothetical protein
MMTIPSRTPENGLLQRKIGLACSGQRAAWLSSGATSKRRTAPNMNSSRWAATSSRFSGSAARAPENCSKATTPAALKSRIQFEIIVGMDFSPLCRAKPVNGGRSRHKHCPDARC